ncbi:MAG TPA: rhodanese-like domain-containing protein [Thermoanaerobaculia bacterium]|nr:rhodanese-like domain-containing protein [Thermoanaerobaculia bacterium]
MQKILVQALILIGASILLAIASNAVASRERKLVLPGYYPSATMVPRRETAPPPRVIAPPQTQTVAPAAVTPVTQTVTQTVEPPRVVPPSRRPEKGRPEAGTTATPLAKFAPHPDKAYVEVAYDDAAALQSQGALVLDARRTSVYEQGHIAGSRPFSVWESDIDDKVNKLYEERSDPREQLKPILVYCSGGDCEDSHMLAQKLWGIQFNNVYVYKDGFPDWLKRGGPVHTGTNP